MGWSSLSINLTVAQPKSWFSCCVNKIKTWRPDHPHHPTSNSGITGWLAEDSKTDSFVNIFSVWRTVVRHSNISWKHQYDYTCVCIKVAGWNISEVTTLTSFYPLPSTTVAYKAHIVQLFLFIPSFFSHHKELAEWMDERFTFNSVEICQSAVCCAKNTKCMSDHVPQDLWEDLFLSFPYNISKAGNQYRNSIGWKTQQSSQALANIMNNGRVCRVYAYY